MRNEKKCLLLVYFLCCCIVITGCGYSSTIDNLIDKIESIFEIDIEYKEMLHYIKTEPGPFGEGDELLIIRLTEESSDIIELQLSEKQYTYSFPQTDVIEDYIINNMSIEDSTEQITPLENGYYVIYSKSVDKFLDFNEIEYAISSEDNYSLQRYIYLQFDIDKDILYIRVYS